MNEKTAKILRKYASASGIGINDLKRKWNDMDQYERRDFRREMQAKVAEAADAPEEVASSEPADQE